MEVREDVTQEKKLLNHDYLIIWTVCIKLIILITFNTHLLHSANVPRNGITNASGSLCVHHTYYLYECNVVIYSTN